MPEHVELWVAFLTALAGLVTAGLDFRKHHKTEGVRRFLVDNAPKVVLVVERLAAATPTKKDDKALETIERWAKQAGHYVSPEMREYAKGLLGGAYQEYKVDVLGVPAHEDGEAAKAARSKPPGEPGSGNA